MTKDDANFVRKAVADGEAGRATLGQLARAHDICAREGANKTLGILREEIRRMTPRPERWTFLRSVFAGLIAGSIVSLTVGRRR